jgi:hypothetical protein
MELWIDLKEWKAYMRSKGIEIREGERHNRTDGEAHYILSHGDKHFELHANVWDKAKHWKESIKWANNITR